jgi:hypothetical protein
MKTKFTFLLWVMMLFTLACAPINSLLGLNESSGTVSELWSDVPPLEGATKADLEMPLAFQLMIRAMTQGGVDYIAFTTTKTPDEVKNFYTVELMQANGWKVVDLEGNETNQQSCVGDQADAGSAGAVCLFGKQEGEKQILLAIVVAQNEQAQQTDVFYARLAGIEIEITPPPEGSVPPAATQPDLAAGIPPYGIDKRPMLSGNNAGISVLTDKAKAKA